MRRTGTYRFNTRKGAGLPLVQDCIAAAVLAVAVLGASTSSCTKEDDILDGTAICFGVSTSYSNGPATRTEYSGKDQSNSSISSSSTMER